MVPRRRSKGVDEPGHPASNIGLEAKLNRRAGPAPRLASQNAAERPVECRPHRSSASIRVTRARSPASRAPRLAPAIPPPTIRISHSIEAAELAIRGLGYVLESRTV